MRSKVRILKLYFIICVLNISISSLSIAFIPLGDFQGNPQQKTAAYMIGAVFWVGAILGYCSLVLLNRQRKADFRKIKSSYTPRIGIKCFFRNFYGMTADVICGISLVLSAILIAVTGSDAKWATFISISVFVFSAQMHSILNGENYKYINKLKKRGNN